MCMGSNRWFWTLSFLEEQQEKRREKSLGDEPTRMGEFWSMLERFKRILELEFEETGFQD
jgi:hypothetical protein